MASRYHVKKDHKVAPVPRPPFLFTLDQIAASLSVSESKLVVEYIHFKDLAPSMIPPETKITAHNISEPGDTYDWRVSESEYMRWLRRKGFRSRYTQLF